MSQFRKAISVCFSKYATFSGRAPRSEFWWFFLFQILVSIAAATPSYAIDGLVAHGILDVTSGMMPMLVARALEIVVSLSCLMPTLAVGSRRLHDMGKSGWWQLISLTVVGLPLLIYWWAKPTVDARTASL